MRSDRTNEDQRIELPPEVFDTPELKRSLAEAILGGREPLPPDLVADLEEAIRRSPELTADFREAVRKSPKLMAALQEGVRRQTLDQHPPLLAAIRADAQWYLDARGERRIIGSDWELLKVVAHLSWRSDTFVALLLYRLRACLLRRRIPVLPNVIHRICVVGWQVCVGPWVVIRPGVYFPHGQVVIDGKVEIGSHVAIAPWVTIGVRHGEPVGPTLGDHVFVGTGAKLLGPIQIGRGAWIGANAVVVHDVEPNATVVGVPAREVSSARSGRTGLP